MGNFWEQYQKASAAESGGGVLCEATIETGYKIYLTGSAQDESWFSCPPGNDKIREDTRTQAAAYARRYNSDAKPQWGIQIRAHREDALSRGSPVTWKADRFFNTQSWTDACKSIVVPSLQANGILPPWTGWITLGFQDDPYKVGLGDAGKTDEDADGNPRFPKIAYVTRTFKNREEALGSAMVSSISTGEQIAADIPFNEPRAPREYEVEDWLNCADSIRTMSATVTREVLAQRFGVEQKWIDAVLDA